MAETPIKISSVRADKIKFAISLCGRLIKFTQRKLHLRSEELKMTIDDLLTKAGWRLISNQHNKPYLEVKNGNKTNYVPLHSEAVKNLIITTLMKETGNIPTRGEREQIYDGLMARALISEESLRIWHRTAKTPNGIEIDLNNREGCCISITKGGWEVKMPTAAFSRPSSMKSMPSPIGGATWDIFTKHFRTKSEEDLKLIIGFMLAALNPDGPYPFLVLQGEQGSAKSTTTRWIKSIIDPSVGLTRGLIRKEHDLFIAAQNNHLLSFDNVSLITKDVSDVFCRLATGASFSTRTLYSNDEETLIDIIKPVLLNGITDLISRPDLASRSIVIELASISPSKRKTLMELDREFYSDLPQMLGVLMDGLSSALLLQDQVRLQELPRMADTIVWCTAAEKGLCWEEGSFLKAFEGNQLNAVLNNLANDPVSIAVRSWIASWGDQKTEWTGTATELMVALNAHKPLLEYSKAWPTTPGYLSAYFTRMAQSLRNIGIDFGGRDRNSYMRSLTFKKMDNFNALNDIASKESVASERPRNKLFDDDDGWLTM